MDWLDALMKWVIVPVGGFVLFIWQRQVDHHVDIAILKDHRRNSEQERRENRETIKEIYAKLDRIEEALRHSR